MISAYDDFTKEMERLHRGLDASGTKDSISSKINILWDLWEKDYANTPIEVLKRMVDKFIKTASSRTVLYSEFVALRSFCMTPRQANESKYCFKCLGSGSLAAIRTEGEYVSGDTCFRCPNCQNWRGIFSECIPIWVDSFVSKGYNLKTTASGPVNIHRGNLKDTIKGLAEQKKMAV